MQKGESKAVHSGEKFPKIVYNKNFWKCAKILLWYVWVTKGFISLILKLFLNFLAMKVEIF